MTTQHEAATSNAGRQEGTRLDSGRAVASLVLGLCSILAGWTFFIPLIGLYAGVTAFLRGTPRRGFAGWGVALNALALSGWIIFMFLLGGLGLAAVFLSDPSVLNNS